MLGRTLCREWHDWQVIPGDLPEMDITDPAAVDAALQQFQPDAVVHCAAMTAVDLCESQQDMAYRINVSGSEIVAQACHRRGIRLIAISTDYVFDGDSPRPYHEYDPATGGATVYGKTKFAGEEAVRRHCPDHLIARISWLYGAGGPSFVHTMLNLADGSRPTLKVVSDQIGNPTSTTAVARKLRTLLQVPGLSGTWHLTCEGECSWFDFAREIFRLSGKNQTVIPCTTAEFPRPAPRPLNSRLEKRRLREAGFPPMPHWKDALSEFISSEFGVSE